MTIEDLARLVKHCRDAQRTYWRTLGCHDRDFARDWERRLDLAVLQVLNPPEPSLFDSATPRKEGP